MPRIQMRIVRIQVREVVWALPCLLLALPVLWLLAAWFGFDANAAATLRHQASTVLPGYAWQSLLLALGVGVGVVLLGSALAVAVTLFEFPLRRTLEWLLLLPLAMPAYVLAYAWTDALQPSGTLHLAAREALLGPSAAGRLWPDVRSLPGAVLLFILCLYPYVYLLTRTALSERAVQMMEAARLLGAGLRRRLLEVALPLARPAIAAGAVLALMETLADYGVGAYFGLTTFSTGIYRAWLSMNDRVAAAQLASLLLLVVAGLLLAERSARARMRFAPSRGSAAVAERRVPLTGAARGWVPALALLPVLLGFVLPVGWLAWLVVQQGLHGEFGLPWEPFAQWAWASFRLATVAAVLATALALVLGFALRHQRASTGQAAASGAVPGASGGLLPAAVGVLSLGYAVPGAVLAVGLLSLLGALSALTPGLAWTAAFTGTALGLIYAYLARFSAVALQSVQAGYARLPPSLDESARLLGASAPRVFFAVHLPLLRRSALAAGLLVFVDVMKELPATLVLRPFGSDTLAVVAYNLARDERLAEAALPSLAIVAVGLLPVLLLSRAMRQERVQPSPS
jgi:iron(III) transport system permease protein